MILAVLVLILVLIQPFSVMIWAIFPNNYSKNKKTSYKERFSILTILFSKVNFIISLLTIPYSIQLMAELTVAKLKGFETLLAIVLAFVSVIALLTYVSWIISYIYAIKVARKNDLFQSIDFLNKYKVKCLDWFIK